VSLDADFAELAALRGAPPKVIWLRCGNQATAIVAGLLQKHGEAIAAFERNDAACLEIY
jgi:predicted nuclease of predicted toxin-antitoxin system